jgi:hypothetical protein
MPGGDHHRRRLGPRQIVFAAIDFAVGKIDLEGVELRKRLLKR